MKPIQENKPIDSKKLKIIKKIISEFLGVEEEKITPEADFYSDLNASKLEVSDLIIICQKKFSLKIDSESIKKINTVADLINLLEENSDEF